MLQDRRLVRGATNEVEGVIRTRAVGLIERVQPNHLRDLERPRGRSLGQLGARRTRTELSLTGHIAFAEIGVPAIVPPLGASE